MFNLLNKLKQTGEKARAALGAKDVIEAIGAGCAMIAWADGELEAKEKEKFAKIIQTHPMTEHLDKAAIVAQFSKISTSCELDVDIGKQIAMKELRDVKKQETRDAIFLLMFAIAKSDGEVEESEKVVLRQVATIWGIDTSEYDL